MILAICDDIDADRALIDTLLRQYLENNNITAQIYTFQSGEDFIKHSGTKFDAVFMDIFMDGIDGLEAAKQYHNKMCKFIFTTISPDFSLKSFSVNVAHYLLKPITYEGISEAMQRCFPIAEKNDFIYIKQQRLTVPISQSDIVFIEVFNNILIIHTVKKDIKVRMTLKAIYEMLDPTAFLRPQRSHIVNMNYIDEISADSIILLNGNKIYIARELIPNVIGTYETFLFNQIRKGKNLQ